jgi:NitT/TauT family transport system substrate-binding protein
MKRRSFLVLSAVSGAAAPRIAAAQTTIHMIVGTAPIDAAMGPVYAQRAGIFKKYGLDVDIQLLSSGAALSAAVIGGTLNVAGNNMLGLAAAHVKGVPFQVIAPGTVYLSEKPAEMLLVRKDATIRTAADLNGKTIASPALGDLLSTATMAWIDQNGGDSKTVKHVELSPPATPAALEAGRIDAAAIAEPRLSDALRSNNVRVFAKVYDAIAKRFLISGFFATTDYVKANPEAVLRYARAQREANVFANANQEKTAPWLAEATKVDLDLVQHTSREIFAETLDLAMIQSVIEAAARYKVIDRAFDAKEMVSVVALNLRA